MRMVLMDTSVRVRPFWEGDPNLERPLNEGEVPCHPFIAGEPACGNLKNRQEILSLLQLLPLATQAKHEEVLQFIEQNRQMGKRLGYINVHLSAAAVLTGVPMWTYEKRLNKANEGLGIRYNHI